MEDLNKSIIDSEDPKDIDAEINSESFRNSSFSEVYNALEDTWQNDFASQYELCVVFPAVKGEFTEKGKGYITSLQKIGFQLFIYKNLDPENFIIVLLKMPMERMKQIALLHKIKMPLDSFVIKKLMTEGDSEAGIAGVEINDSNEFSPYSPYEYIYAPYDPNIDQSIYWKEEDAKDPFSELAKLRVASIMLESRMPDGSENLKIQRYLRNGWLKACFPLHNRSKTKDIQDKWFKYPFQNLPLTDLKNYFGEKIALYFAFVDHFNRFLIIPALVGIPFQVAVWAMNDYNAPFLPFYSFFMVIASVVMLEHWKRKEKTIALEWGMIGFEENENDRPDFKGKYITSFIDGSKMRFYPDEKRRNSLRLSFFAVSALIILVIGTVAGIYAIRYTISGSVGDSNAQTIASVSNAVMIFILNYTYTFVANALSEAENHRTTTQFEDSMIFKIFLFQFVNSYSSFFYLAFVAENIGECPEDGCMSTLAINLGIIYGSRLVVGPLLQLGIPYLLYQYKYKTKILTNAGKISRPEKELLLDPYDVINNSLSDYSEIAIQFGYTSMFITALPIAAVFSLFCNVVEIRGDGWKILNLFQRPLPKPAEDIGNWQKIFLFLCGVSVITNASLSIFTMHVLDDIPTSTRYWLYFIFQWSCFIIQFLIMEAIPDVPEEIEIQLQRQDFIARKLIDKEPDEPVINVDALVKEPVFENYPQNVSKKAGIVHNILTSFSVKS